MLWGQGTARRPGGRREKKGAFRGEVKPLARVVLMVGFEAFNLPLYRQVVSGHPSTALVWGVDNCTLPPLVMTSVLVWDSDLGRGRVGLMASKHCRWYRLCIRCRRDSPSLRVGGGE